MRVLRCLAARAHSDHLAPRCLGRVSGRTSSAGVGDRSGSLDEQTAMIRLMAAHLAGHRTYRNIRSGVG